MGARNFNNPKTVSGGNIHEHFCLDLRSRDGVDPMSKRPSSGN
jgi:hypothetical protein